MTEQYDILLAQLAGHSLKEEAGLWASFQNLKQARNRFVHEGVARIGNTAVDPARAGELITAAVQITRKVREWVPEHLRWPVYEYPMQVTFTKIIPAPGTRVPAEGAGEEGATPESDQAARDQKQESVR